MVSLAEVESGRTFSLVTQPAIQPDLGLTEHITRRLGDRFVDEEIQTALSERSFSINLTDLAREALALSLYERMVTHPSSRPTFRPAEIKISMLGCPSVRFCATPKALDHEQPSLIEPASTRFEEALVQLIKLRAEKHPDKHKPSSKKARVWQSRFKRAECAALKSLSRIVTDAYEVTEVNDRFLPKPDIQTDSATQAVKPTVIFQHQPKPEPEAAKSPPLFPPWVAVGLLGLTLAGTAVITAGCGKPPDQSQTIPATSPATAFPDPTIQPREGMCTCPPTQWSFNKNPYYNPGDTIQVGKYSPACEVDESKKPSWVVFLENPENPYRYYSGIGCPPENIDLWSKGHPPIPSTTAPSRTPKAVKLPLPETTATPTAKLPTTKINKVYTNPGCNPPDISRGCAGPTIVCEQPAYQPDIPIVTVSYANSNGERIVTVRGSGSLKDATAKAQFCDKASQCTDIRMTRSSDLLGPILGPSNEWIGTFIISSQPGTSAQVRVQITQPTIYCSDPKLQPVSLEAATFIEIDMGQK